MSFFAYGAFTLSGWLSQNHSAKFHGSLLRSEPRDARIPVWALPVSLAATSGIDVSFSSSGYLDVSVHRVPFHTLWIGVWIHGFTVWVSPFRDPWITGYVLLPMAFRSLSRLSSALSAKASTLRPYLLDLYRIALRLLLIKACFVSTKSVYFSDVLIFKSYLLINLCMKFSRYMLCHQLILMMETERFELLTPCLQGRCSPS